MHYLSYKEKKKNDKEGLWTETHVDKIWWIAITDRKQNSISKKQMILKKGNEPSYKDAGYVQQCKAFLVRN